MSYAGTDAIIPANFTVEIPDDTSWVADTLDEILSLAPQLFRSSTETQFETSSLCGSLPIRRVSEKLIVVGEATENEGRAKRPSLNVHAPGPR